MVSGPYLNDYPSTDIDDASPENIHRLKNFFEMTLEENRKPFDELCDFLVQNFETKMNDVQKPLKNSGIGSRLYKKLLGK
jgi:hypothetical protein